MMWLGRLTFLAKGKRFEGDDALISHRRAAVQTTAAALIAEHMRKNPSFPKYDALYNATAFFVGYSDDLTPYEYSKAIADLNEAQADVLNIARNDKLFMKLQRELLKFRPPAIYSGTGNITTYDPEALKGEPKPEILQKALASTMGMRFMGQRFVIDSYVMGRLCFPTVNEFSGNGAPFTGAPKRFRSTALDFMALLGSPEAYEILKEQQMTAYKGYGEEFAKLKKEMAALSTEDWHRNLYLGQLDAMKSLFSRTADGYQPFQRTKQWEKRQLQTVLGGWTALRHDTILYVKQPYGLRAGAAPPPKPKAVGYVEPEPEYYARMLSNVRQLKRGLAELGLADRMPASVRSRTDKLEWFIETLMDISIAELEQKEMRKEHVSFLESIADYISGIQGKDPKEFTSEIVADVFTDGTKGVVVEEGTGKFNSLVVAWHKPDGTIEVAIGPVYSYYEFTMPMNQRLTDEKWQQMLKNNPPERPDWIRSFTPVPGPLPEERF
ncbi:MAG: DUF3160 domain-containing protein [Planctomycetota bacterium]|nr:DUF3160 domain-containing protein [Planctomycetota bacterium]